MLDPALREYCNTDRQREYFDAIVKHGSYRAGAKSLGLSHQNVIRAMHDIKARAARAGYSPEHDMTRTVPDGYHVRGTSTLYDEEGKPKMQWVKSSIDHERQKELMMEAVKALCEEITPVAPTAPPSIVESHLLNQYTITDYHLGMLSWPDETGDDWNTDIAEQMLVDWFGAAIESSPNAETAIFAQLGDFLHYDSLDAVTPTSKHILDADTRFQNVVRAAIRVIRKVVSMLLQKHQKVHLIMAEGNHDLASSIWLRELLSALYDKEPRITVDDNPDPYYCYVHGKTTLFYHHGHKRKVANIDTVFVAKYKAEFGGADHVYAHMGHYHHRHMIETALMLVEQHRTLAAADSHASRGGWMSKREAVVITYHDVYGEVGRVIINPDMLK